MKMISSTSITSTNGVTLMSAFWPSSYFPPFLPPSFAAIYSCSASRAAGLVRAICATRTMNARRSRKAPSMPADDDLGRLCHRGPVRPVRGRHGSRSATGPLPVKGGERGQAHDGRDPCRRAPSERRWRGHRRRRRAPGLDRRRDGTETLAELKGRWIDVVATERRFRADRLRRRARSTRPRRQPMRRSSASSPMRSRWRTSPSTQGPAPGGRHLRRSGALVRPHRRAEAGAAQVGRAATSWPPSAPTAVS